MVVRRIERDKQILIQQHSKTSLLRTLRNQQEAVFMCDTAMSGWPILFTNKSCQDMLDWTEGALGGRGVWDVFRVDPGCKVGAPLIWHAELRAPSVQADTSVSDGFGQSHVHLALLTHVTVLCLLTEMLASMPNAAGLKDAASALTDAASARTDAALTLPCPILPCFALPCTPGFAGAGQSTASTGQEVQVQHHSICNQVSHTC